MTEEDILVTEAAETRVSTRASPNYQSISRSPIGQSRLSFAYETSPISIRSRSEMKMHLPKGDDESVFEEEGSQLLETPTETMQRRINGFYSKTLPTIDNLDREQKRQFAPEFSQKAYL